MRLKAQHQILIEATCYNMHQLIPLPFWAGGKMAEGPSNLAATWGLGTLDLLVR
jgi:hypothetical protein